MSVDSQPDHVNGGSDFGSLGVPVAVSRFVIEKVMTSAVHHARGALIGAAYITAQRANKVIQLKCGERNLLEKQN